MKLPATIAISSLMIFPLLSSAQQEQTTPCLSDSIGTLFIAAGPSAYSVTGGYGAHVQLGYPVSKRFSTELKAVYTGNRWEDYSLQADPLGPGITNDYHSGKVFTVSLAATGYLIGNRQPEGKGGIYAGAGLGYTSWKMSSTASSQVPVTDSGYYFYNKDFGNRDFSASLTLGADRRTGKGRIYMELLYSFGIAGTEYTDYRYEKKAYWGSLENQTIKGFRHFESFAFINMGYRHTLLLKKKKSKRMP